MQRQDIISICLLLILLWFFFRRSFNKPRRTTSSPASFPTSAKATKQTYMLKAGPRTLIEMPEPTTRLLTYEEESRAAWARQRLWMQYQYKDKSGHITERTVEIYQPERDEVLFTWCRLKQEPRTFARRNILQWRLLPERFEYDPIVARYWDEEAGLDQSEKMPWRRWLELQPEFPTTHYDSR